MFIPAAWLGGFDFNERGWQAQGVYMMTLLFGVGGGFWGGLIDIWKPDKKERKP